MKLIDKLQDIFVIGEDGKHGQTTYVSVPVVEMDRKSDVYFEGESPIRLPQIVLFDNEIHVVTLWEEDMNQVLEQVMFRFDNGRMDLNDKTIKVVSVERAEPVEQVHRFIFRTEVEVEVE